ncbi:hypothetical protein TRFO_15867 [Tritrichomonas foetus]|uniref:Inosine/uridine-preferring nucleoside hydrolase domain-containing protein n=1 Tax=Tritrichomonas foetus TaxID=1144522 RepID=A0A1J4KSJ4_9EUKA|nr:hypothetical protein TRFO_15867 [Tritrichomonas foetus]|eukprot:OHT13856.1 hypothetical protein TRFO_15867 [Tritrichomonas foetus]
MSHPNQVKILSIGIPTNIGLALKKRPDIAGLINEIVAMGGGGYIYDNPQGRAKISYYKQNEPWTEDYNMKVEPPFPLPTPSNSEKRDTNETENNNENNSNEMPNFVINGNIVHLFPNHNFSGDTIASKIMFDTPDLRIRIIPHAVTSKFWLTGRSIEHLKNKSQELFDKSLELKFREPTQPSQVVGINLYEWFIRRNGNGNGQCPHDPLTVHEAAFGSDLSSAKYIPGTFIIHKWAAYATFVPHNDGKHLLGIEAINPDDFLNQLTSVLIEKD